MQTSPDSMEAPRFSLEDLAPQVQASGSFHASLGSVWLKIQSPGIGPRRESMLFPCGLNLMYQAFDGQKNGHLGPSFCGWSWLYFGVGEFTTHFRAYFSGEWDVYWGYDLAK